MGRPVALLIVDPDDQSATWLAGILAELAEQLIRTTSPDEAMAAFATEGPDVLGVVVGPGSSDADAVALAGRLQEAAPDVAVVLLRQEGQDSGELLRAALRAGVRDVVTALSDPAAVRGACARALELTRALRGLGGAPDRRPAAAADPARAKAGKLITVFSSKGGCGKTFVATNLALALAAHAEVALVDLDLHFGDVAIMLQLFPARTIQDAARASGGGLDPVTMKSFLTRHQSGLWALVAPSEPTVADTISPTAVVTILRALRQRFGYVVVDTPAAFSDQVLAAFDESDAIAMLATLDVPSIKNLKLALRTMESLRYPRDKTCLVINTRSRRAASPRRSADSPTSSPPPRRGAPPAPGAVVRAGRCFSVPERRLGVPVPKAGPVAYAHTYPDSGWYEPHWGVGVMRMRSTRAR